MKRFLILSLVLGMFHGTTFGAPAEPWEIEPFTPADVTLQTQPDSKGRYIYGPSYATGLPNLEDPQSMPFDDTANLPEGFLVKRFPSRYAELGWTLKVPQGKYYVGLQIRSDSGGDPLFASKGISGSGGDPVVRLNERRILFSTMTAPVELLPGQMAAELQSEEALDVKPGDRIWVDDMVEISNPFVVNLILYSKPPIRGPILCGRVWDESTFYQGDWSAQLDVAMLSDSSATAKYTILNVVNRPLKLKVLVRVVDYYQKEIASEEKQIELPDLKLFEGQISFQTGSVPHYRVDLEIMDKNTGLQTSTYEFVRSNLTDSVRREMLLTGTWEAVGIPRTIELGNPPGEGTEWKRVSVPGQLWRYNWNPLVSKEEGTWTPGGMIPTHVAWMRKVFDLPEWLAGKRYELWFSKVGFETHLYVNGKKVGMHFGDADPFSFDVTSAIRSGKNEIILGIRDGIIAAAAPEAIKNADLSFPAMPTRWLAPCDIMTDGAAAALTGIGGDVWLRAMPAVFVEDVFIVPSVRKKTLTLEVTVHNNTNQDVKTTIFPSVWEFGRKGFDIKETPIEVATGKSAKYTIIHPWANPRLWEPLDPHLYELRVSLGEDGDCWRDRFGFREFWQKDNLYYLNGRVARLWRIGGISSFQNYSWGRVFSNLKRGINGPGCYSVRMRPGPEKGGVTLADEAGILIHAGVNRSMGASESILSSEEFWENCKRITTSLTRAFRNHPSIVMYEGGNEFWCFSGYANLPSANDVAGQRLAAIGRAIREVDPTRPITFDADADLGGLWDTIDIHYGMGRGNTLDPTTGYYLPDSAFYRNFDKPFVKGAPVGMSSWQNITRPWGEKPVSHGEIGHFFLYLPFDVSLIGGDMVYRGNEYNRSRYVGMFDRFIFDGARDLDSAMMQPWENWAVSGTRQLSFPPICVNVLNTEGHYRAGEKITKYLNIHHDVWQEEKLTFQWTLSDGQKRYAEDDEVMTFSSGQLVRKVLAFQAPETTKRLDLVFRVKLLKGVEPVYTHDYPMVIYPASEPSLKVPANTVMYDPSGKTVELFKSIGADIPVISTPDSSSLKNVKLLLIGRDAVDQNIVDSSRDIMRFVETGGRVISFEQSSELQWLPIPIQPDLPRRQSYTFPRIPDHPVLNGLLDTDLQLWRDDRLVARKEFRKPNNGSYLPLIDSGGKPGLEWTPMVEIYHGKGSYLLCQMLVTERARVEPIARHLLGNMLVYAALPLYRQRQTVAFIGTSSGSLSRALQNLRFQVDSLVQDKDIDLAKYRAVIVDGQEKVSLSTATDLIAFARNGGTVILHDLKPETASVWADATGITFTVRSAKASRSTGHVMLTGRHSLFAGVSGHELYWHTSEHVDSGGDFFQKTAFDKLFEYECAIDPKKADVLTFPSVIVSIPLGKGYVIIDQLRWDKANNVKSQGLANRLGSWLLTDLGASFRPMPPVRNLPGGLSYRTVDLSSFANRSLADEVSGDGKGGWSDQGNLVDLRDFPTGKITLKGIPYLITEPKSCIVLNQIGALSEVKGIPINGRVEAFYFLYSGAWISSGVHAGTYIINYADGESIEIPLIGEKNIRDWASSKPNTSFSGEESGIKTRLVWTGSNTAWQITSVYSMEWVNPDPEREIKSVDFVGTVNPNSWGEGRPVPILIALTSAEK